jgi:hypothetical protein
MSCHPLTLPLSQAEKLLGSPFFQRYGVNLPSSLTEGPSFTWGVFPLPTGVGLRYGRSLHWLEAFLGGLGREDFRGGGPPLGTRLMLSRSGFTSIRHSPWLARPVHSPGSPSLPRPPFALHVPLRCRIFAPACHRLRLWRPRLRSRLTLGRLTAPRNPQVCGVCGSHTDCATHSGIRSWLPSTCPYDQASPGEPALPYHLPPSQNGERSMASVRDLSLVTFSVPGHSTSELLRTLSMMAASKPTSWLSWHPDPLCHCAAVGDLSRWSGLFPFRRRSLAPAVSLACLPRSHHATGGSWHSAFG